MIRGAYFFLAAILTCCLSGCGSWGDGSRDGTLNELDGMPDADGDSFSEIAPPEGVAFDFDTSLAMSITNTITRSQAQAAADVKLPALISSNVALTAKVSLDLTYPGGMTQELPGTFPVNPFELSFEIACPDSIEAQLTVVAVAPIVGEEAVTTFGPLLYEQGVGENMFECGSVVHITTYADESGTLRAEFGSE